MYVCKAVKKFKGMYVYLSLCVQEGRTAVMYGVKGGNVEVTKFLTTSGADLTIIDNVRTKVYSV